MPHRHGLELRYAETDHDIDSRWDESDTVGLAYSFGWDAGALWEARQDSLKYLRQIAKASQAEPRVSLDEPEPEPDNKAPVREMGALSAALAVIISEVVRLRKMES